MLYISFKGIAYVLYYCLGKERLFLVASDKEGNNALVPDENMIVTKLWELAGQELTLYWNKVLCASTVVY